MGDEDIRVNWRADIVLGNGERVIQGRLSKIGKRRAVVKVDHNLQPGHYCNLVLMPPKSSPGELSQCIVGRSVVGVSVLSSMQFHITLERLELEGDGEALLEEHIRMHREIWKMPH